MNNPNRWVIHTTDDDLAYDRVVFVVEAYRDCERRHKSRVQSGALTNGYRANSVSQFILELCNNTEHLSLSYPPSPPPRLTLQAESCEYSTNEASNNPFERQGTE